MAWTRRTIRRSDHFVEPLFLSLQHRNSNEQLGVGVGSPTIRGFVERYPRLLENALLTASDYVAWQLASHIGLAGHTVRQRLAQVLATLARTIGRKTPDGVELQITNEELANAANITPFTASRLMSKWQRDRALVKRRGKVLLRSPERLFLRTLPPLLL